MPMTAVDTKDLPRAPVYTKRPGEEPISGYVLVEPLGRGGFGEVWKCEAPGGLHKAIKFVAGSDPLGYRGDGQLR
jgi:eukaryotic-like serine/threonine-protein kinase